VYYSSKVKVKMGRRAINFSRCMFALLLPELEIELEDIMSFLFLISPYQTRQGMGHAKEKIVGDPNDVFNVFKWKEVRLNLPGTPEYDPSMMWVAKVREDGWVTADFFIYMDDFRPTGPNAEE
jgi:hypothetical protein